jgi:hypothetical protein
MTTQTDNITSTLTRRTRPHPACKIARLPAEVREMINQSIADNVTNAEIISRLEAIGHHDITVKNLSRWAYSGYLTWLRHRERLDVIRFQSEANCELIREVEASDPTSCSRLNNMYLATQLAQLMHEVNFTEMKKLMEKDPNTYFRLARAINAQTRNTLRIQRLQAEREQKQAAVATADQRDLGQLPSTTSEEGYAAAAAFYGLPQRFSVDLPKPPNSAKNNENPQPNQSQPIP